MYKQDYGKLEEYNGLILTLEPKDKYSEVPRILARDSDAFSPHWKASIKNQTHWLDTDNVQETSIEGISI